MIYGRHNIAEFGTNTIFFVYFFTPVPFAFFLLTVCVCVRVCVKVILPCPSSNIASVTGCAWPLTSSCWVLLWSVTTSGFTAWFSQLDKNVKKKHHPHVKHISTFHHMQNFTSGMIHPHSLGSFVQLPWPEYFFPTWPQKTLSKQFCVQVWVHERAFIPHTEEPTFCYTFYYDEVAAFHTTWPGFNDRAGEEAAPQTFRFIIHQPTALTTNNYILVGGGGWGSVALCSVNTHTPQKKKSSEWTCNKQMT